MIKVIIFDVDGTIVDSVDLHATAWQEAFRDFGKEIAYHDVRWQIGKGGDQLLPVFLSQQEIEKFGAELEEHRTRLFADKYLGLVRPFPRVRELFRRIRSDFRQIVLASSAKSEELDVYKRIADIADLLDDDTSADDVARSKPHPDIFEAALSKAGHPAPHEVRVIGDTPYDALAARKLHLTTIGLLSGGFPEKELRKAGCVSIFKDPADLLQRYGQSPLVEGIDIAA